MNIDNIYFLIAHKCWALINPDNKLSFWAATSVQAKICFVVVRGSNLSALSHQETQLGYWYL
jgi:hypothetical protein